MKADLVESMLGGDRRALARLFSLLERDHESLARIMRAIHPYTGAAYCIGVTGPPGAGKSTIVDRLVQLLRRDGANVGVLAIDPTSPYTGGAFLGDRVRMRRHYLDRGVFIRSLATRGVHGGLSRVASASVKLLDAFGKDTIFVETVGVGQTELDIMNVADTVVVVLVPEGGDSVQALKAGLVEIGDVFAVNKADRPGADRIAAALETVQSLGEGDSGWTPPVRLTQAHRGEGIQALYDAILQHRRVLESTSNLQRRRDARQRHEFTAAMRAGLEATIEHLAGKDGVLGSLAKRVENGELDPYAAASEALGDGALLSRVAEVLKDSLPESSSRPRRSPSKTS